MFGLSEYPLKISGFSFLYYIFFVPLHQNFKLRIKKWTNK